jgi:hypothetical protein
MFKLDIEYEQDLINYKEHVINSLVEKYDSFDYRGPGRSMRNIELSLVYWLIKTFKPNGFFESGIWRARCTFVIAESLKYLELDIPYYIACSKKYKKSPEVKKVVKDYPNIIPIYAQGQAAAKKVSGINKLGMLIDGPKWRDFADMKQLYKRIQQNNKIIFSYHHDISKNHTKDRPYFRKYYKRNKEIFCHWEPKVSKTSKFLIENNNRETIMGGALIRRSIL